MKLLFVHGLGASRDDFLLTAIRPLLPASTGHAGTIIAGYLHYIPSVTPPATD